MKQLDVTQFEGYKEAQTNLVQLRKDINRKMKARIMECNPGDDQHLFIDSTGNITEQGFELLDFVGQTEKVKTLIKREKNLKLSIADAECYVRTIQQLCEESLQYKLNVYATIDRIQNYCILFAHGCLTVKDVRLIQRCFFDFLTEKMNAAKSCCDSYTFTDFAFRKDDEYLRYQRSKFYLCEVSEKLNNLQQGSSLVDLAKAIQIVHNTPWFIVDHSFGDVYEIIPTDKCILFCVYNNNCTQKSFSFLIYVHGDEFEIPSVDAFTDHI